MIQRCGFVSSLFKCSSLSEVLLRPYLLWYVGDQHNFGKLFLEMTYWEFIMVQLCVWDPHDGPVACNKTSPFVWYVARCAAKWMGSAVPSLTQHSSTFRRRCYSGSKVSKLKCHAVNLPGATTHWHVSLISLRRSTCGSHCCRWHLASTLNANIVASLPER